MDKVRQNSLMARSNKIGDSSHLSLNEDFVCLLSIINLEIKLQINAFK